MFQANKSPPMRAAPICTSACLPFAARLSQDQQGFLSADVPESSYNQMAYTTNKILNRTKEEDCTGITSERKYYCTGRSFVKRSLRRREWQLTLRGTVHVPRLGSERIRNEAAALRFVSEHTNVPVPQLYCCFEDDEATYLVVEFVDGVQMAELSDDNKEVIKCELREHLATLQQLRSNRVGSPDLSGLIVPPYRVLQELLHDD